MPGPVVVRRPGPGNRAWLAALLGGLLTLTAAAGTPAASPDQAWIKPKAPQSLLIDMVRDPDSGRFVVVGERGHVLVSADAVRWTQVAAPTRAMLTAVAMRGGTGFAVGHDATILRTRDGGDTWQRVYHDPGEQAPFLDVLLIDAERAVAVGAYGLYAETRDGGDNWELTVLEPEALDAPDASEDDPGEEFFYDLHLNDIAVSDSGRWYIAAEAGTVYRSDDQGASWLRLPSPYEGSFFGVLPLSGDSLLLFGLQGRLYRSDNAGLDWQQIETRVDATLSRGLRLDGGKALIIGHAGIVLNEVDADGRLTRTRLTNRPALSDAHLLDNGELLTVGEGGIRRWPAATVSGQ